MFNYCGPVGENLDPQTAGAPLRKPLLNKNLFYYFIASAVHCSRRFDLVVIYKMFELAQ